MALLVTAAICDGLTLFTAALLLASAEGITFISHGFTVSLLVTSAGSQAVLAGYSCLWLAMIVVAGCTFYAVSSPKGRPQGFLGLDAGSVML